MAVACNIFKTSREPEGGKYFSVKYIHFVSMLLIHNIRRTKMEKVVESCIHARGL